MIPEIISAHWRMRIGKRFFYANMTQVTEFPESKDGLPFDIAHSFCSPLAAVMGAINECAVYKFITKPWNDDDLRLTVGLALEQYDLIKKNKELTKKEKEYKKEISSLSKFADLNKSQLGRMMLKSKMITQERLEKAEILQQRKKYSLPRSLVELGYVRESEINELIKKSLGVEGINLSEFPIDKPTIQILPQSVSEQGIIIPVKLEGRKLTIAMADPTDFNKIDDLRFATGLEIFPVMASEREILMKLDECFGTANYLEEAVDILDEFDPMDRVEVILEEEECLEELVLSKDIPHAVRIVNAIISEGIRLSASDIHIEPKDDHALVRYRIDGMLHDKIQIPLKLYLPTISRIKIISEIDIAERRRPQDGRVSVKTASKIVDLRVSTLPTIKGEKVVLRILDRNAPIVKISKLGLSSDQLVLLKRIISKPQGIVLASGPTGSGKTTTLYSLLKEIANPSDNFITIENPVEYFLGTAGQVLVRDKIGLSFVSVLKSVLRQDPDIIMLGEIRDPETAQVAFQAALTGHLVMSTIHTNNSIATINRLRHQELEPFIISSALEAVIAQRLVRKICGKCKEEYIPADEILFLLGVSEEARNEITFYRGKGCEACNDTGYSKRTGLFEIFTVNEEVKHLISINASEDELTRAAKHDHMTTLQEDGLAKIKSGDTTCEEVLRVLGPKSKTGINCLNCDRQIDERLPLCPFCGHYSGSICLNCKERLEAEWLLCPFCGKEKINSKKE